MPHSHTADQPMAPLGRDTDHKQPNDTMKAIEVKQPALSLLQPDDCKTKPGLKYHTAKQGPNIKP